MRAFKVRTARACLCRIITMSRMNRLNTPAEMAARLFYVVHFGLILAGGMALFRVFFTHNLQTTEWAGVALVAALLLRVYLRHTRRWEACGRSLRSLIDGHAPPEFGPETPEAELYALLERRSELELLRGRRGFDPWEMSTLQHQIEDLLRRHPALVALLKYYETH